MEDRSTTTQQIISHKKDKSKFYFFLVAICALLSTNVYFYVKFKSSGEKLYTVALQREELQREIDRAEAELDNVKNANLNDFTPELISYEESARKTISDLRVELDDVNISDKKITQAKEVIQQLKQRVTMIKDESSELRLQNDILRKENEELSSKVLEKSTEVIELQGHNHDLSRKVSTASSIKVSNILVNGVEKNRKGIYEIETKAKRVDKIQIKFSIADNELAKIGGKDIFVRVIDPMGNLIADTSNMFPIQDGNKLQFTFKERIDFTNKGEEYEFLWSDTQKFKKGAYTVLLYADGSIMGRSSIVLK